MSSVMMMNMDLKTQGKICLIDLGFSFRAFGHSTAYALSKLRRVFANPDFSSDLFLAVFCDIDLRSALSSFPVSLSFVFPGHSQKVTLDRLFCHHQFSFFLGLPTFFVFIVSKLAVAGTFPPFFFLVVFCLSSLYLLSNRSALL